jgi:hypothetical protein
MIDQFYTPPELAHILVGCLPKSFRPKVIADFAAGEGSLLSAADARWPRAKKVANDVSTITVRALRATRPEWIVANADFMRDRSVRSSSLRSWERKIDLVLLNPPFSQRSRKPIPVEYDGEEFGASLAVAFMVRTLQFLKNGGYLLAVLPDGCLVSRCDRKVWERLHANFHVEVLRDNATSAFAGVRARTSLVRLSHTPSTRSVAQDSLDVGYAATHELRRGQVQMHSVTISRSPDALPLVHTSHLLHGRVALTGPRVAARREVHGPALLFPRVGRVTPEKVCVLDAGHTVVLSDCVIARELVSIDQTIRLRKEIVLEWAAFAEAYRGTGAPYLTLDRAAYVLRRIGKRVTGTEVFARTETDEAGIWA